MYKNGMTMWLTRDKCRYFDAYRVFAGPRKPVLRSSLFGGKTYQVQVLGDQEETTEVARMCPFGFHAAFPDIELRKGECVKVSVDIREIKR